MRSIVSSFWQWLDRLGTVAVLAVALLVGFQYLYPAKPSGDRESIPIPAAPVALDRLSLIGGPNAAVGMIVFSDFDCPFCSRFANQTWPILRKEYVDTGKAVVSFRHLPMERLHPRAFRAAEASECAGRQGRFWEFHDHLFGSRLKKTAGDNSASLDDAVARAIEDLSLEPKQYADCLSGGGAERVNADLALATTLSIRATPVFLIGRTTPSGEITVSAIVEGARPIENFRSALDAVLR